MKVAVVASHERAALDVIARLGMVGKSVPLAAEKSPLDGHRFTAVLIAKQARVGDADWWQNLLGRNSGPIWTLDEWGTS